MAYSGDPREDDDLREISDHIIMEIAWAQSARRHRVGRASVLAVLANPASEVQISERDSRIEVWFIGRDDRGRDLEVMGVAVDGVLLIIHVMPAMFRRNHGRT